MENKPLIYLEDVYVDYPVGGGLLKRVLNDIDLKVVSGEFITVVGPTGCGKSTLLRLILGSERPTRGTVLIYGRAVYEPDRSRGIVYQKYSLFPNRTVLENIVFGLELQAFSLIGRTLNGILHGRMRAAFREEAHKYLGRIGLQGDGDKYPHQLSGGMRQRVAIAQALITKPKILLMDEPFGALDDTTRQSMQAFILEQHEESGMTIFFVTHDLEEAIYLGTRVLVISPYYKTDAENSAGSKIVTDKPTCGIHPKPSNFKYSPEFNALLEQIRRDGLDPNHLQHVSEFDLAHPDSFRTVKAEEWKKGGPNGI